MPNLFEHADTPAFCHGLSHRVTTTLPKSGQSRSGWRVPTAWQGLCGEPQRKQNRKTPRYEHQHTHRKSPRGAPSGPPAGERTRTASRRATPPLSVLVREDDSLAAFLLGRTGVNVKQLRDDVQRAVTSLPRVEGAGEQFFSQECSRVVQRAVDFTRTFNDKYASVEHLLLALVAERGQAADLLKRHGATEKELVEAIRTFRKGATVDSPTAEKEFDALGKYAINLNERARSGKLDPVIGATRRSAACCKFCRAARRTTRYWSVKRVSARPPSPRASPTGSSTATSPRT